MWKFLKVLILFIPQPFFPRFSVFCYFPQMLSLVQVVARNAFTFKCFWKISPRWLLPIWESSRLGKIKASLWAGTSGSQDTGLNNQPQFFENKVHFTSSGTRNLYLEYGLLSSKMPLRKEAGDKAKRLKVFSFPGCYKLYLVSRVLMKLMPRIFVSLFDALKKFVY